MAIRATMRTALEPPEEEDWGAFPGLTLTWLMATVLLRGRTSAYQPEARARPVPWAPGPLRTGAGPPYTVVGMANQSADDGAAQRQALAALIGGYRATQMIGVAARLGVADHLAAGPQGRAPWPPRWASHPEALLRLLRGLVNLGLLVESAGAETAARRGRPVLPDAAGGGAAGGRPRLAAGLGHLGGGPLLPRLGGPRPQRRQRRDGVRARLRAALLRLPRRAPEAGEQFNRAMTDFSLAIGAAVAGEYDFAPYRTVVDLGGGRGHLLAAILGRHPALRGILFDLPHLVPTAQAYLDGGRAAGAGQRRGRGLLRLRAPGRPLRPQPHRARLGRCAVGAPAARLPGGRPAPAGAC